LRELLDSRRAINSPAAPDRDPTARLQLAVGQSNLSRLEIPLGQLGMLGRVEGLLPDPVKQSRPFFCHRVRFCLHVRIRGGPRLWCCWA
jgi:hypothetical protein